MYRTKFRVTEHRTTVEAGAEIVMTAVDDQRLLIKDFSGTIQMHVEQPEVWPIGKIYYVDFSPVPVEVADTAGQAVNR